MPTDPYPNQFLRGIIYAADGETISIRNTQTYNTERGSWNTLNPGDTTATITTQAESIIIDRNELIPASGLQVGQQILICTDVLPTGENGDAVGYIIQVER